MPLIKNEYGNIPLWKKPPDCVYLPGNARRSAQACRNLGIDYAIAVVKFDRKGRPKFDGIVVEEQYADAVKQEVKAIEGRSFRSLGARKRARVRKQEREQEVFAKAILEQFPSCPVAHQIAAHACEIGSGRVGRTRTLDTDEAARLAVIAFVRHRYTDYEELLEGGDWYDREEIRQAIAPEISRVLEEWAMQTPIRA